MKIGNNFRKTGFALLVLALSLLLLHEVEGAGKKTQKKSSTTRTAKNRPASSKKANKKQVGKNNKSKNKPGKIITKNVPKDFCPMPGKGDVQEFLVLKERMGSVGTDKYTLAQREDDLSEAVKDFINSRYTTFYKNPQAAEGAALAGFKRTQDSELNDLFKKVEKTTGTKAEDLQALGFGETFLNEFARAKTSSGRGMFQMLDGFCKDNGIDTGKKATTSCKGRGKKRKCVTTPGRPDTRFNKEAVSFKAGKVLAEYRSEFGGDTPEGRENQFAAWHCGPGCMRQNQKLSLEYGIKKPTMTKALLVANKKTSPKLFYFVKKHLGIDFSHPYPAGILLAKSEIKKYNNKDLMDEVIARMNRVIASAKDNKKPSRYTVFSQPKILGLKIPEVEVVAETTQHSGVDIPTTYKLAPELMGALFYVSYETRLQMEAECPGVLFKPLKLLKVMSDGWSAEISPDMHNKQREILEEIIQDVANRGAIAMEDEGMSSLKLCLTGEEKWMEFFKKSYKQAQKSEKSLKEVKDLLEEPNTTPNQE